MNSIQQKFWFFILCLFVTGCATGRNAKNIVTTQTGITKSGKIENITSQRDTVKGNVVHNYYSYDKEELIKMIEERDKKIELLSKEVAKVKEFTKPPVLLFKGAQIDKINDNYQVLIHFLPSKNETLGELIFYIKIKEGNSKILECKPSVDHHAYTGGKAKITDDGKKATLGYYIIGGARLPTLKIVLTEPTILEITGNKLEKPVIYEAK